MSVERTRFEQAADVDLALEQRHLLAARDRHGAAAARRRRAAQHLAVLGDVDAVAAQRRAQRLRAVGVLGAAHRLARGVEPLPGVDRHRLLLHVLRGDHEDLGGGRHPASTFCAPSSRSVRMPPACRVLHALRVGVLDGQLPDLLVDGSSS
jgi:hypothetical protein